MWRCENCRVLYREWLALCSECGGWRTLTPAPLSEGHGGPSRTPGPRSRGALITAQDLAQMDRPSLPLSPAWRGLFGALPPVFGLLAYGPPGAGKSTWLLTLSNELARHGTLVYVASEEGQANSMIEKLGRLEIHSPRIFVSSAITVEEMLADLDKVEGARFLILDSLSCFPLTAVELSEIAEHRRLGVCFSLHARKDGGFRGAMALSHWVDVVARIENGLVTLEKNRFGPLRSQFLEFAGATKQEVT